MRYIRASAVATPWYAFGGALGLSDDAAVAGEDRFDASAFAVPHLEAPGRLEGNISRLLFAFPAGLVRSHSCAASCAFAQPGWFPDASLKQSPLSMCWFLSRCVAEMGRAHRQAEFVYLLA